MVNKRLSVKQCVLNFVIIYSTRVTMILIIYLDCNALGLKNRINVLYYKYVLWVDFNSVNYCTCCQRTIYSNLYNGSVVIRKSKPHPKIVVCCIVKLLTDKQTASFLRSTSRPYKHLVMYWFMPDHHTVSVVSLPVNSYAIYIIDFSDLVFTFLVKTIFVLIGFCFQRFKVC